MKEYKSKPTSFEFQWDDRKEALNILKHGISFSAASYVFTDENRVEMYDESHSLYEDRYIVLGFVSKLLFVVYTERDDAIRLISARIATREEEEIYNEYNKGSNTTGR